MLLIFVNKWHYLSTLDTTFFHPHTLICITQPDARLATLGFHGFHEIHVVSAVVSDNILQREFFDESAVESTIQHILDRHKSVPVVIMTVNEIAIELCARMRDRFCAIGGPSIANAHLFRDKIAMKAALDGVVMVPRHIAVNPDQLTDCLQLGFPLVIKPRAGVSSMDVTVIADADELCAWTGKGDFEADEFISGTLYHADLAFCAGRPVFAEACRYMHPLVDTQQGHPVASILLMPDDEERESLLVEACRVVVALGACDSTYHLEFFLRDGQWVFLEIACRVPGVYITRMYREACGVDLVVMHFLLCAGLPLPRCAPVTRAVCGLRYPHQKGVVVAVNIPTTIAVDCVHQIINVAPGDCHTHAPGHILSTAMEFVYTADNAQAIRELFAALTHKRLVTIK